MYFNNRCFISMFSEAADQPRENEADCHTKRSIRQV